MSFCFQVALRRRTAVLAFAALSLLLALPASAQQVGDATPNETRKTEELRFRGDTLPLPPQHNAPWKAPKDDFGNNFVSATQTLFAQGLADPRGCEYRNIEIIVTPGWQEASTVQTRGWVLPQAKKATRASTRFAVCWNGLVYPLLSVGAKADLKKDVEAALQNEKLERALRAEENKRRTSIRATRSVVFLHRIVREKDSLSATNLLPVKACLLLRLGETELARRVWTEGTSGWNDSRIYFGGWIKDAKRDAYEWLAIDWMWARFDRMLNARMRADDKLALADAQFLVAKRPLVEAEVKKRTPAVGVSAKVEETKGFDPDASFRRELEREAEEGKPTLAFLDVVPSALQDQKRRVELPATSFAPSEDLSQQSVAQLIEQLDQIRASYQNSPVVRALIAKDAEAVEPLLHIVETDKRLTRAVADNWFFHVPGLKEEQQRRLISVSGVAWKTLQEILQLPLSSLGTVKTRALWNEHKGQPRAELWYRILSDENAPEEMWMQAAGNIVAPPPPTESKHLINGSYSPPAFFISPIKAERETMRGESLRSKTNPSVTKLLLQRIAQQENEYSPHTSPSNTDSRVTTLAILLSRWDGAAALPVLHSQLWRLENRVEKEGAARALFGRELERIARITVARKEAGDAKALEDYSQWIQKVPEEQLLWDFEKNFTPLWLYPQDGASSYAASTLLRTLDPASETDGKNPPKNWGKISASLRTPLLGVPSIKDHVGWQLQDKTVIGHIAVTRDAASIPVPGTNTTRQSLFKRLKFSFADGEPKNWEVIEAETTAERALSTATQIDLRLCDFYAFSVLERREDLPKDAPQFQLSWPQEKRDAALKQVADFVRAYQPDARAYPRF